MADPVGMLIINRERQDKYSHSSGIRTAPVRAPLPLLGAFRLVRVGHAALVGIAVAASAGGVVLWVLGRGGGAVVRVVFVAVVSGIAGAGAIDVAHATAAGRVLYQIGVSGEFWRQRRAM